MLAELRQEPNWFVKMAPLAGLIAAEFDELNRWPMGTDWDSFFPEIGPSFDFGIDLQVLIVGVHRLTLEAIRQKQDSEIQSLTRSLEDAETVAAQEAGIEYHYDSMRRAANSLAAVALVTRFHHCISQLTKEVRGKAEPHGLLHELKFLSECLGNGPVPINFFEKLVTVRDSIVHADSNAEWDYRGNRREVSSEYIGLGMKTEISEPQLADAVANAVKQVKWYEEAMRRKTP